VDPVWLTRNIAKSWRHSVGYADMARRLLLTYSAKLPAGLRGREWTIGFRYPPPIGRVRLVLRANGGSDYFIHSEVFEHEYYRVPLALPPATILDLGANIGLSGVYFARCFPKAQIACVEPIPGNLKLLERNLALNDVKATIFAAAIDQSDGFVQMKLDTKDYGHKVVANSECIFMTTLKVDAMSVPTIMQRLGWERIGLIKIDIEGHERVLLAGNCDWLNRVDAMCIECHEGFDETDLQGLARLFHFDSPCRLPGTWFMSRTATTASHAYSC
jgi:FkbM family methyltransferase